MHVGILGLLKQNFCAEKHTLFFVLCTYCKSCCFIHVSACLNKLAYHRNDRLCLLTSSLTRSWITCTKQQLVATIRTIVHTLKKANFTNYRLMTVRHNQSIAGLGAGIKMFQPQQLLALTLRRDAAQKDLVAIATVSAAVAVNQTPGHKPSFKGNSTIVEKKYSK